MAFNIRMAPLSFAPASENRLKAVATDRPRATNGGCCIIQSMEWEILWTEISLFENEGRSQQPKSIEHESAAREREREGVCLSVCKMPQLVSS